MNVVLDTNVIVAGMLNPYGTPADVLRLASAGRITPLIDVRIMAEYRGVLRRPRFRFDRERIDKFLSYMETAGIQVVPGPLAHTLPDPDDEPFLEAALAGRAEALITGNLRHYPASLRAGAAVFSPAQFIEKHRAALSRRP